MHPIPKGQDDFAQLIPVAHQAVRHLSPALRDLPRLTDLPAGNIALRLKPPHHHSVILAVDPNDREPVDGASYATQYNGAIFPDRVSFLQIEYRRFFGKTSWLTHPLEWAGLMLEINPTAIPAGKVPIIGVLSDGPYSADRLREFIAGRVTGLLVSDNGDPVHLLGFGTDDPGLGNQNIVPGPDYFPEQYAASGAGDCLMPLIQDRQTMLFSTTEPCEPGDLIVMWRRAEITRPGELQAMIKRLRSPLPPNLVLPNWQGEALPQILLVETLNPPQILGVPLDDLMAIHRFIGFPEKTYKLSHDEMRQLADQQRVDRQITEAPKRHAAASSRKRKVSASA